MKKIIVISGKILLLLISLIAILIGFLIFDIGLVTVIITANEKTNLNPIFLIIGFINLGYFEFVLWYLGKIIQ